MTLSSSALCTLADLKTELGISGSSSDSRLERLIEVATQTILRYCRRPEGFHYEAARVDDLKGYATPILQAVKTPLLTITSIAFDPSGSNQVISSTEYRLDSSDEGRIYRSDGWLWTAAYGEDILPYAMPGTEERLYRLTSTCGYVTAGQVSGLLTRTLPYDLEDACLMLAAMRYRWAPRNVGVASESLLSWSASYRDATADAGIPPEVAIVLEPYKKVVWA